MERKIKNFNFKTIKWNLILPVIHIIVSWIYQSFFWKIQDLDPNLLIPIEPAYASFVSLQAERAMVYILSKILGCILIFAIWQIFFMLIRKKRILPFFLVFMGILFIFIWFPYSWLLEWDDLIIYTQSIRYYPDYWQNMLTGCLYNACLMVFCHAQAIPVIQCSFFLGAIYYLSCKCQQHFGKKAGWVPYICLLFSENYILMINPYRNCIYAVFCIWFYSLLAFDFLEKRIYSKGRFLLMGGLALILTVLRTEGIFLAALFILILIWQKREKIKEIAAYATVFLCAVLVLMLPQKIGEAKYFGKDYMIVNYINMIASCLNDEKADLSYDGVEEDLQAIAVICPPEIIQYNGTVAYYDYNLRTRGSISQSFATKEEQAAFLQAGFRLFSHNLPAVLYNRIRYFAGANGISDLEFELKYPASDAVLDMLAIRSSFGLNEVIDGKRAPYLQAWNHNVIHASLYTLLSATLDKWDYLLKSLRLFFISRIFSICMLLLTGVTLTKKRQWKETFVSLIILAMWAVIFVFSPEAREAYYYPVYYISLIWSAVFLGKEIVDASLPKNTEDKTE